VTVPNDAGNCLACHNENTFELPLAENVLLTINRTTGVANGQDATPGDVTNARKAVPNDTDWVFTPATGACYSCHDSAESVAHMEDNGGAINKNRIDVLNFVETCSVCHGAGSSHAVEVVHTALNN
jgi:OmcA/MtrC family decaheme c-type cytochrome